MSLGPGLQATLDERLWEHVERSFDPEPTDSSIRLPSGENAISRAQ
jgi:hypothetical protein